MDELTRWTVESALLHADRTNKRLWVVVILLVVSLLGTNVGWIYYESQWEVVETEITQENEDGINNYIGNDGDIHNGETDNQDTQ